MSPSLVPLDHQPDLAEPEQMVPDDAPAEQTAPDEAELLRDLVLRAHPDVVPELVQGATVQELLASLPLARAAWTNALERARQVMTPAETAIPAGGTVRTTTLDPAGLSPLAKIRAGMR